MSRYQVKSQLYSDSEAQRKGAAQVLDDCGPSSISAAVAWATQYEINPSAADGVAAKAKATGRKEQQGVSDNGSSLADLIKTARVLGADARWAKSWDDAVAAAKAGAAIGVWVQAPKGYPEHAKSKWHKRWERWWWVKKKDPTRTYGHMTSAGWNAEHGWQFADPTMDDRDPAEKYAFKISEAELKAIASGKPGAIHTHLIIITAKRKAATPVTTPKAPETTTPKATPPAQTAAPQAPAPAAQPTPAPAPARKAPRATTPLPDLTAVDWSGVGEGAADAARIAFEGAKSGRGFWGKLGAALKAVATRTAIDDALLDAARSAITVAISVMLATGAPLLDLTTGDLRTVGSAALAAGLQTLIKFIDPDNKAYGVTKAQGPR
jgi:hypothetical protein